MAERLLADRRLKRDYFIQDDATPSEVEEVVRQLAESERLESGRSAISAKQQRESKRQFNATLDQAAGMNQPISSFAEGALDAALAGTPSAAASLSGADLNDPRAPRNTNPYSYVVGQTAGNVIPLGSILKAGKGLKSLGLAGARLGGLYSGASSISSDIQAGERDVGKMLENAVVPTAIGSVAGGALGAGAPLAGRVIGEKLAQRQARKVLANPQPAGMLQPPPLLRSALEQPAAMTQQQAQKYATQAIEHEFQNVPESRLIKSAVGPVGKTAYKFDRILGDSMPEVSKYWKEDSGMRGMLNATRQAKDQVWKEVESALALAGDEGVTIEGNVIADAIGEVAKSRKKLIELGGKSAEIDAVLAKANAYRNHGKLSVADAEAILRETNDELAAYYALTGVPAEKAKANMALQADVALAKTLREELDKEISQLADVKFGALKRKWGNMHELDMALERRIPVVERQQILSLAEQIDLPNAIRQSIMQGGALRGPVNLMIASMIKRQGTPDAKVNRAMQAYLKRQKPKIPSKTVIPKRP